MKKIPLVTDQNNPVIKEYVVAMKKGKLREELKHELVGCYHNMALMAPDAAIDLAIDQLEQLILQREKEMRHKLISAISSLEGEKCCNHCEVNHYYSGITDALKQFESQPQAEEEKE